MFDLTDYVWIVWLVVILVCVIIELISLEFTFLMIAVGSLGGLGANALGAPWWVQILVAAILAVLLIALIRPVLLRMTRRGADPTPSNIAALIGLGGRVTAPLGEHGGLVKLANGETWTARLAANVPSSVTLDVAARVVVVAIEGSTAVVAPAASDPTESSIERNPA